MSDAHGARMARKKAVIDASIARADQARGVLLVHTGNGKGKSSAAFGMAARGLGRGLRVGVVQFGGAPAALIEQADTVTEMKEAKHALPV